MDWTSWTDIKETNIFMSKLRNRLLKISLEKRIITFWKYKKNLRNIVKCIY